MANNSTRSAKTKVIHAGFLLTDPDIEPKSEQSILIEGERINLEPEHLKVCGSALERVKLFNSNLQVIDEAFEYLSIKASKGEKGQYFTPRPVVKMAVKMYLYIILKLEENIDH